MRFGTLALAFGASSFLLVAQGFTVASRADSCQASIQGLRDLIGSKGGLVTSIKYEDYGQRSPFSNASTILFLGLEHDGTEWEAAPRHSKIVRIRI